MSRSNAIYFDSWNFVRWLGKRWKDFFRISVGNLKELMRNIGRGVPKISPHSSNILEVRLSFSSLIGTQPSGVATVSASVVLFD